MNKTKFLILLTVFIDIIGIGIVIPILPFYVERFSSSPLVLTSLFSVFALCSFLSAPVIGAWSDRLGRRPMLLISIISTALGWAIFALAHNIWFLFLGRIIDGLAAGNFPIAQAYLTDIAKDDKERAHNLGLIGAIFGIAFIIGPFLGGILGSVFHSLPFWFVAGLASVNAILAHFILPETNINKSSAPISVNPFVPLKSAIKNINLRANYIAWFLFCLGIAAFQSVFSLYMAKTFNFTEFSLGIIFAITGIIIAVNQGYFLKHIWLKYFSEPFLELLTVGIFAVGLALLAAPYLWVVYLILLLTTFSQGILRVVMISQIVAQATPDNRGEVLGVTSSITSISMAVAPLVAGLLFGIRPTWPFFFGSLIMIIAFAVLYRKTKELKNLKLEESTEIISEI